MPWWTSTSGCAVPISRLVTTSCFSESEKDEKRSSEATRWRTCAAMPAICGVAIDVPDM